MSPLWDPTPFVVQAKWNWGLIVALLGCVLFWVLVGVFVWWAADGR